MRPLPTLVSTEHQLTTKPLTWTTKYSKPLVNFAYLSRHLENRGSDGLDFCSRTCGSIVLATLISTQHNLTTKPLTWTSKYFRTSAKQAIYQGFQQAQRSSEVRWASIMGPHYLVPPASLADTLST